MSASVKCLCVRLVNRLYAELQRPTFFVCAAHVFRSYTALLDSKDWHFRRALKPIMPSLLYDEGAQERDPALSCVSSRRSVDRSGGQLNQCFFMISRALGSISVLLLMTVFSVTAHAQESLPWQQTVPQTESLTQEPLLRLRQAEHYFNRIKTLKASFTQRSPDGGIGRGTVYISRPGKMRWEYEQPSPVLMIADDETLIYYDEELDEVTYLSLEDTLASFLTRPVIHFADDDLRVIHLREGAGSLRFTLLQTAKLDEGSLTVVMETEPMRLHQLIVADAAGQLTEITLNNIQRGLRLEESLFTFKRPIINRERGVRR